LTKKIEGAGPVLFERSRRAKHLNISIMPFTGIRVAVPYGISFERAEKIVYAKINWIKKQLDRITTLQHKHEPFLRNSLHIDRAAAGDMLIQKLNELAHKYGFTYNRVFIRNQKTRWGSCSSGNNIYLNVKLSLLPEELTDYVILHELVHTRIKNHSKGFWRELGKYVGDTRGMERRLKEYGLGFL
jgi:predicted metal-dependent hydrolase